MVPKSVALMYPGATVRAILLPVRAARVLLAPLVALLNRTGNLLLRLLGQPVSAHISYVYTPEEMALLIEESHEQGLLGAEEHRWMERLIRFGDRTLEQIMVPRVRVVGVPPAATVPEMRAAVRAHGNPACSGPHGDIY